MYSIVRDGYYGARSRVLIVSHDMLWPRIGGGRIRIGSLIDRALRDVRVDLVVVAPENDVVRDSPAVVGQDGLGIHIFVDEAASSTVPERSSKEATALIRRLAARDDGYDAVHIEGHYLLPVVPPELHARTVVAEQNIESRLLAQRMAVGEAVSVEDIGAMRESECSAWRRAAAVVTLTPEDNAEVAGRAPDVRPHFIANGWDHLPLRTSAPPETGTLERPALLFMGDYDYAPNRDAYVWLVTDVFPRIRARIPAARLLLAGINMPDDLVRLGHAQEGAEVLGFVEDLMGELGRADVVLCPLRVGGGIKVKVIEAVCRAGLIVSTSVGVQGVPACLRSAICVADDAGEFAGHVVRLCADPGERGRRRRLLLENQHVVPRWEDTAASLMSLWSRVSRDADRHQT